MFHKIRHQVFFHNLYWIGSLALSVMIVAIVLIGAVNTFVTPQQDVFVQIPINVTAKEQANYGDGVEQFVFPGVNIAIVDEILGDSTITDQRSLESRLSEVATILQQPIPFATENSELVDGNTPTEQNNETVVIPTNTQSSTPTQNTSLTLIPVTGTSTSTLLPSQTASLTLTPSFTSTLNPTIILSPTLTNSPLPTFTGTFTNTATFTFTPTFTNSVTPTFTFTPTSTSSLTPTFTFTPTHTNTFTFTPTSTSSRTPTFTFTPTYTSSVTPTLTFTPTRTNTATFTFTPTVTSSNTPTYTLTFTHTNTPSITPTLTQSPSPTATLAICNTTSKTNLLKYMWPPDGSVNVPVDVIPVIVFDQSIDPTTLVYGDPSRIVICQKSSDSSNACRNGTVINATLEIKSMVYQNDWVIIHLQENLDAGILYTMFAGNQIKSLPECSTYSIPLGGREQSNFTSITD